MLGREFLTLKLCVNKTESKHTSAMSPERLKIIKQI